MKLKKLTINNIASIEHAEINFDQAPLSDERLFLITGETGSGKSTLIDCLCLALYGSTPRLKTRSQDNYSNGQDKKVGISDPRQLLRRGSGQADICLTFDDNEGVPYVATWEVRRSRDKADGALQGIKRCLKTADGYEPAVTKSGPKEIDPFIQQLIGLDSTQFFRTVVLAQGKFAEFLNSDDKEKSDLLEKMTGTEIYSQVGAKIHETCKEKGNQCAIIRGQMENIVTLSEEQKAIINDELTRCGHEYAAVDSQLKQATAMAQWVNDRASIGQEIDKRTGLLQQQVAQTESQTHREQQQLVNDWDNTADARHQLKESQAAQELMAKLQEQQPAIQEEFDRLCAALRAAVADIDDKRRQIQDLTAAIRQEEPNRAMYEAMERIKALLQQWLKNNKNMADYSRDLDKDKQQLPEAQQQADGLLAESKKLENAIEVLQNQYDALNTTQISKDKDNLSETAQALVSFKSKLDAITETQKAINGLKTDRANEQTTLERHKATLDGNRALRDQAKEHLDRQTGWNELLIQAQKSVHEGDTCPVCGNPITRLLVPKSESELGQLRQALDHAEAVLRENEGNIRVSELRIGDYDKQIQDNLDLLDKRQDDISAHWDGTRQLLAKCGKKVDEMADSAMADALIADIEAQTRLLNDKLEKAAAVRKSIKDEQDKLMTANKAHHRADLRLNTLKKSIQSQSELIDRIRQENESLTHDLDGLIVMKDWQARAGEEFLTQLQEATDRYQQAVGTRDALTRQVELSSTAIPAMQRSKENLHGLTDNGLTTDTVPEDLGSRWSDLEKRQVELNTQLEGARKAADKAQQALNAHLSRLPDITIGRLDELNSHNQDEISAIKLEHKTLNEGILAMRAAITTLTGQLEDLKGKKPDFIEENPERLEEIISEKKGLAEALNTRMAELKAQLTTDENNVRRLGDRKQELEKAEAEFRLWQQLNEALGGADGAKFRKIAQSYILGELLASANGYLRQFNNHYELVSKPGTLLILVHDLVHGDRTSVNTLSGGESFMVALALALALSNMSGKVFSVDTLFIDEGFGSLSPIYLDNVTETLNRLYDIGGRRVGIISHVEMLKERVPTQIKVFRSPVNNTVSLVEVTR